MRIEQGNANAPLIMFQHELDEILKSERRKDMIGIYMYIQMMKLQGMVMVPDVLISRLFGTKYKESIDELITIGLVKSITVDVIDPDELVKKNITSYDFNHKFPEQVIQYEIIREKTVEVEAKPKKERLIPSEIAFAIAEQWIYYLKERFQLDASKKRYGTAITIEKMFQKACDTPENIRDTFEWYVKNYKYHKFLVHVNNVYDIVYQYTKIKDARNATVANRGSDAVI
jgi:hypothetical protein